MLRLQRYIGRTVMAAILLVLVVIVSLDMLLSLVDQVSDFKKGYGFVEAAKYVGLTIPGRLFETLPFASLVGCLLGLGALASSSELVVIKAAGVSSARITWAVLRPILLLIVLGMLVAQYVAPKTQQIAESYRSISLQNRKEGLSVHGLWHREGDQYMHFNAVQPNGVLYGVSLFQFADQDLKKSLFAQRATYQGGQWLLEDVRETNFHGDTTTVSESARQPWDTGLAPDLLNILVLDPDDLSLTGLRDYARYLDAQELNASEYQLAFWRKALQPLAVAGMVLIAVSFVFGPLRQVTVGFRIFTGVLVGIVFRTLQDMLAPASLVFGFEPLYASIAPIVLCFIVGGVLLARR